MYEIKQINIVCVLTVLLTHGVHQHELHEGTHNQHYNNNNNNNNNSKSQTANS